MGWQQRFGQVSFVISVFVAVEAQGNHCLANRPKRTATPIHETTRHDLSKASVHDATLVTVEPILYQVLIRTVADNRHDPTTGDFPGVFDASA